MRLITCRQNGALVVGHWNRVQVLVAKQKSSVGTATLSVTRTRLASRDGRLCLEFPAVVVVGLDQLVGVARVDESHVGSRGTELRETYPDHVVDIKWAIPDSN